MEYFYFVKSGIEKIPIIVFPSRMALYWVDIRRFVHQESGAQAVLSDDGMCHKEQQVYAQKKRV